MYVIYEKFDLNYFEPLSDIPKVTEAIDYVKNKKFTYIELIQKDRLLKKRKHLIEELKNKVLINIKVNIFEKVFKLIFTKPNLIKNNI